MKFPIEPDSPEMRLAEAIATELAIEGFDSGMCLPFAMKLMAVCDEGHDDPDKGVQSLKESRKRTDEWWVKHHPHTKSAKQARIRLKK